MLHPQGIAVGRNWMSTNKLISLIMKYEAGIEFIVFLESDWLLVEIIERKSLILRNSYGVPMVHLPVTIAFKSRKQQIPIHGMTTTSVGGKVSQSSST